MTTITVIIATYNRSTDLKRCLDDLLKQETAGQFSFDILVADNNSTDNTREVSRSYDEKFPGRVGYIFEPRQGKCFALNAAVKNAKGDILAFTDDDVQVDPQWLLNIVRCFQEHHCDGVGGRILPLYPDNSPAWIKENVQQLAGTIVVYDYGTETKPYKKPAYEFLGANYAFKRQVFDECGWFRTDIGPGQSTYGDDTEFVGRTIKAGKSLFYCGQALVWHPVDVKRMTLKYIAQWNIALGRYRIIVDEKGEIDPKLVYWAGIPRHLVGQMLRDVLRAGWCIFDKQKFLSSWIQLSRNWGKAMQIRKIYWQKRSKPELSTR